MHDMISKGRQGAYPRVVGVDVWTAKLTPDLVNVIRDRYWKGGEGQRGLAAEFGVTKNAIAMLVNGGSWKSVPYDFPLERRSQSQKSS